MPASTVLELLRALVTEPDGINRALSLHAGPSLRANAEREVFMEGDPSDTVFILVEGWVALTVSSGDADSVRNTLLLQAPAVFGDRDVLAGTECLEGARCLVSSRLLACDADSFLKQYREVPHLGALLTRDLARRYASAVLLARLQVLPLPERLPHLLAALPSPVSSPSERMRLLALLANATPKSVQRALAAAPTAPRSEAAQDFPEVYTNRIFHRLLPELWTDALLSS